MSSDTEKFNASQRRLCPDGACIGLIDESGRCKECGKTASGKVEASAPAWVDDGGDDLPPMAAAGGDPETQLETDGGFDPGRKLCPDGNCVGVIGPEGRCKVCGTAG